MEVGGRADTIREDMRVGGGRERKRDLDAEDRLEEGREANL